MRTARLTLEAIGPDDQDEVVRLQTDPANFDYEWPNPLDEAHEQYKRWSKHWLQRGWGYWLVHRSDTGELIGIGGPSSTELDDGPAINVYYRFIPSARGKGYASELLAATITAVKQLELGLPLVIITDLDNLPSIRLAERHGFKEYLFGEHRGRLSRFFHLPADEL